MKTEEVTFLSEGQRISGILHLPGAKNSPCVVASHGLLSSKNSEKYIALGEQLSWQGMGMLRFDFRGIGESEGRIEDDTVGRRILDLGSAVAFVRSRLGAETRIGLLGSSLGGYVSLFKASMDRGVRAAVVWATPFHLDDLAESKKEEHPLPGEAFFKDLPKHRLLPLLPKVEHCMVIHGDQDETVPVDQAWEIFHSLGAPKEIHVIEGADHRLTEPTHRQRAIDLTLDWFRGYLL